MPYLKYCSSRLHGREQGAALAVSKCENFDLLIGFKTVFWSKKHLFFCTHKKIHENLTVRAGGLKTYGLSDRKISVFYAFP